MSAVAEDDSLTVYLDQGNLLMQKWKYQEATEVYKSALRFDSTSVKALKNLGIATAALGRQEKANRSFEQAYRIDPKDADVCNNLAAILSNMGRSQAAVKLYLEALALDTANALLLTNLGQEYLKLGLAGKALPVLRKAAELKPDKLLIAFLMANGFAASKVYDSAEFYYLKASGDKQSDPILLYRLGTVQRQLGKNKEAAANFARSLTLKPGQRDCAQMLGLTLLDLEKYDQATEHFRTAIEADSSYQPAWIGLGMSLALNNQTDEADKILKRLFATDSALGFQMLQLTARQRAKAKQSGD